MRSDHLLVDIKDHTSANDTSLVRMCVAYVDMCGQLHAVWIKLPLQVRDSNNSRMYKSAYDCGLWDNISAILVLITLKY
jgi:hypothetical protein